MRVKQKLMYMTLGGVLVLAGYILASFANDSVAQSGVQDGKSAAYLFNDENGGVVGALGKDGKSQAHL